MRSETVALVVAAIAEIALVWITVFLNLDFIFIFFYGASVAAALFLAITFLPKYTIREMRAEPAAALAYLANRLRLAGYRVEGGAGKLTVRIGSFSAILVSARRTDTGCRVRYQPYATPSGWGTLLTLMLIVYTATAGFALGIYGFLRSASFVKSRVAPLLPEDGRIPEVPAADRTRSDLVEALSEAYRTAAEAEEAVRSSYHDSLAIVICGAIVGWFLLIIAFSLTLSDPDFPGRIGTAVLWSTAIAAAAAVPTAWVIRMRIWPQVVAYREWAGRLRTAMMRAGSSEDLERSEPSGFEILMEAAGQVPKWIGFVRRGGINRDSATGLVLLMVIVWTFTLGFAALSLVFLDAVLAGIAGAACVGLAIGTVLFYRRWRRRWDAETERALRDWSLRVDGVRARMEQYLRDL